MLLSIGARRTPQLAIVVQVAEVYFHCGRALVRSERTLDVDADESLLDALLTRGVPAGSGCREGVCDSCEVRVLDGEPEHRDELGAPPGCMYPCVSRARSPRLVLDLWPQDGDRDDGGCAAASYVCLSFEGQIEWVGSHHRA